MAGKEYCKGDMKARCISRILAGLPTGTLTLESLCHPNNHPVACMLKYRWSRIPRQDCSVFTVKTSRTGLWGVCTMLSCCWARSDPSRKHAFLPCSSRHQLPTRGPAYLAKGLGRLKPDSFAFLSAALATDLAACRATTHRELLAISC